MDDLHSETNVDNGTLGEEDRSSAPIEAQQSEWDRRVYRYGCLAPTVNRHIVFRQFRAAHRYRNQLTEIERARRVAVRGVINAARESNAAQAETRKLLKEIDEKAVLLRKGARALCGVYWGTYQLVESADEQSRKMLKIFEDPRFLRWEEEGAVSAQLTGGGIKEKDLANDTRVQMRIAPPKRPGMAPNPMFQILSLRVGSDGRAPVFAEFPIRLHRPLPEGSIIKRVTVRYKRVSPSTEKIHAGACKCGHCSDGFREQWSAEFVVEIPKPSARCGKSIVGVDLGWRVIGDELRVCAWSTPKKNGKRQAGELRLTARELDSFRRVDTLRSTRDDMRNRAIALLSAQRAEWGDAAPEWFREETSHLAHWRSPDRIPRLLRNWQNNRFAGDEMIFEWLSFWQLRERHLLKWENDQRLKNHEHRKKKYQEFARTLAERFEIVVLEDFDIRTFARRPAKDAEKRPDGRRESQQSEKARAYRHLASTSELRLILANAFLTRGGGECRVPAHNTTRICHVCANVEIFDQAKNVTHQCSKCNTEWDQDDNASANLCDRFEALKKIHLCEPCKCRKTAAKDDGAHVRRSGVVKQEMESRFAKGMRLKQEREQAANAEQGSTTT